jgi:hypothetical protein
MAPKGIWDGVFTPEQAARGKTALSQNGCNGCHGAELEGGRGPSLKGDRFITAWENGTVSKLFAKIRDTMPPLNAEQVSPSSKADIVAYLFEVNGFPSGSSELPADTAKLDSVQIVRKDAATAVPNFASSSLLVVLNAANGRWLLALATAPWQSKTLQPRRSKRSEAPPLALRISTSSASPRV